jgi:hypothetical protein
MKMFTECPSIKYIQQILTSIIWSTVTASSSVIVLLILAESTREGARRASIQVEFIVRRSTIQSGNRILNSFTHLIPR